MIDSVFGVPLENCLLDNTTNASANTSPTSVPKGDHHHNNNNNNNNNNPVHDPHDSHDVPLFVVKCVKWLINRIQGNPNPNETFIISNTKYQYLSLSSISYSDLVAL